ncbi:IclR family transcriptional regulator [Companilactobacillus kimchiensis]|uniref:IclR family transcriptional regulator n=1 Tax=Companilactobacillus kimchiensis TaxID=993692 RepID=A0A0R2L9D0_9LACO|nr:IclR family transcriptional regulator [Companilactobacillus kimchiensis]KRN98096.1 IclR family transcriptional regulator [Companilactobacillus kimchiensis]
MTSSSSTLRNGLKILDLLKQTNGLRLSEISIALKLNKTTVYRLLTTLVELNYLKKNNNHYFLSHREIPSDRYNGLGLVSIPIAKNLTDQFTTTAFIGVLKNETVVITQVFPVEQDFEEFDVLGNTTPVNLSALGKAIVASLNPAEQQKIISQLSFATGTKYTLNDQLTFQQNLNVITEKGFALDDEESTLGIRCLAVPIFRDKKVIASLGLSGTFDRLPRNQLHKIANQLIKCSQQITNNFF